MSMKDRNLDAPSSYRTKPCGCIIQKYRQKTGAYVTEQDWCKEHGDAMIASTLTKKELEVYKSKYLSTSSPPDSS